MGVVRSFVSQLRIGQDLTKKSMPAIFCNPYSVLEFVSYRLLGSVNILLEYVQTCRYEHNHNHHTNTRTRVRFLSLYSSLCLP